jgi:hypothetical protein
MTSGLQTIDPATNPHLSGRFAPVDREVDQVTSPSRGRCRPI